MKDVDIVKNVNTNFSAAHLAVYFNKPVLAFLFAWFNYNSKGRAFAKAVFIGHKKDDPTYVDQMIEGIDEYAQKALYRLKEKQSEGCKLSKKLLNHLK